MAFLLLIKAMAHWAHTQWPQINMVDLFVQPLAHAVGCPGRVLRIVVPV